MSRLVRFASAYLVLLASLFSFSVSQNELRNASSDALAVETANDSFITTKRLPSPVDSGGTYAVLASQNSL